MFVLTLIAPTEYGVETFDTDEDIWFGTDPSSSEVTRFTLDPERDSVMKIKGKTFTLGDSSTLGDGLYIDDSIFGPSEGAYKDYEVSPGITYTITFLHKEELGLLYIWVIDQDYGGTILYESLGSNDVWQSYDKVISIPALCTTIRVKFIQIEIHSSPFYIDNFGLSGNILLADPDFYHREAERIGSYHQTLSGRRIYDLLALHYRFKLSWNYMDSDQYEEFRKVFYTNEILYFDDGNVPPLIEGEVVYETDIYNFVGITNPSSTHKAWSASSALLPTSKIDFETTEFSTANYQAVDEDDNNYKETTNPTAGQYLYHKYAFLSGIAKADVQRFRVRVSCLSDDGSFFDIDGCLLFGWNGTHWVELARSTNSAKNYLDYSTYESAIASQFIDSSDNYIRLLLRSRASRDGANSLNLRTYYVEVEINEDLDLVIELTHRAILDDSDVIYVKNLTQGTTLVLNTDYTIASDRRSVTIIGGAVTGDEIEVKYNRYFEVSFFTIPEEWLTGDLEGETQRSVEIELRTLSESG